MCQRWVVLMPVVVTAGCQAIDRPAVAPPMGSAADVNYAHQLWSTLETQRLVGADAIRAKPFLGAAKPHGWILEVFDQNVTVGSYTGFVIVKRNYNGPGVSIASVEADRDRYLTSITVMFQREAGYDEDNLNWFWVKYRPDGSLFTKKMKGMEIALAGRIAKARDPAQSGGCIFCHRSAGGGDYIFYPDITLPGSVQTP